MNEIRRKRYRASEWPALVEQWSNSGETAERFAARIGVKPETLARWRKGVGGKPRSAGALSRDRKSAASVDSVFARVQVVERPVRSDGLIEVVMRDGLLVRLHGSVDVNALSAVLGCMSRC